MPPTKALILDFDGVIVDTERQRFAWIKDYLAQHGVRIDGRSFSFVVGRKTEAVIAHYLPRFTSTIARRAATQRRGILKPECFPLLPGIRETLLAAKKRGLKTCITTGTHRPIVEKTLRVNKLDRLIDLMVTGEEVMSSKADPECYLLTLKRLGIAGKDALVVEDAPAGIQSAKAAGCIVIGLGTYKSETSLRKAGADRYCKDHHAVRKIVETKRYP